MPYLFETHLHTAETSPCGKVKAKQIVALYHQLGYDGIVVTDHFFSHFFEQQGNKPWADKIEHFLTGYRIAKAAGDRVGMTVIPAMEYTFPGTSDDILVYGAEPEQLLRLPDMHLLGPAGLLRTARAHNWLCVQAHPYRHYVSRVYDELIEGMEVINGNARHFGDNKRAVAYATEHKLIAVAGSDFHQEPDAGRCGVWLPEKPKTTTELADILRRCHPFEFRLHLDYQEG